MPIHRSTDKEGTFFQWGTSGKKFYFDPGSESSRTRALNLAKKQQKAIYASGYKGDKQRMKLIKVIKKADAGTKALKDLKKGEYFTLKKIAEPKEREVWVKGDYIREDRTFSVSRFDDMNEEKFLPATKQVFVDFTF